MKRHSVVHGARLLAILLFLFAIGCAHTQGGKIPITTTSEDARQYYLQGRDLSERLRGQESIQFFEKAVAEDPDFALGYLNLSFVQPSVRGFLENLNRAKALIDGASEGERLWILGVEAGFHGLPMKQRALFRELVAAYPDDERAHNILGNHYFGQQEYALAIEEYRKATEIAPDFSQPYNQLGYAYRFLGNYADAERAFGKYIELIPDDPNPHDSYAELLMKMGKFDASIESYRKALSFDPHFVASHIGIATNLNFKGEHEAARAQLSELYNMARNDGERRATHFAVMISYLDEENIDSALEEQDRQYALAEKINDVVAMAGDLVVMGNILLETGKYDEAMGKYRKAVDLVEESDLSDEVKDNNRRGYLFNAARVALKKEDFVTAKTLSQDYRNRVEAINNPFQIRLAHELAGMIALEEKDYDRALGELQQANQQNPYNLYRMALTYEGKGDREKAKEFCMKAVKFNALNNLNYSFVRRKAQQQLDSM